MNDTQGAIEEDDEITYAYGSMGRFGEVISPAGNRPKARSASIPPRLDLIAPLGVSLPPGDRWVKEADFTGPLAVLGRARTRFGAPATVLDADGDGRLDLFLPAAIAGPEGVRDALLRNRADGTFEDVTRNYGLPGNPPAWELPPETSMPTGEWICYLTGVGGNRLYRNLHRRVSSTSRRRPVSPGRAP